MNVETYTLFYEHLHRKILRLTSLNLETNLGKNSFPMKNQICFYANGWDMLTGEQLNMLNSHVTVYSSSEVSMLTVKVL
jgi:hypothetical protein